MTIAAPTPAPAAAPKAARPRRFFARSALALVAIATAAPAVFAGPQGNTKAWDFARTGDISAIQELLLVETSPDATLLLENFDKRETDRAEKIAEVSDEIDGFIEETPAAGLDDLELSKALVSLIELQLLMTDSDAFFADRRVGDLINAADQAAKTAEDEGRWLIANELYYRLDQLTEESGEFKDDSDRLTSRLAMIRLYAPERFYELRNERRLLEEDEPLPPYNATGQDYREKSRGINTYIVTKAIQRAAARHVDRDNLAMADLIVSGFQQVRTMLTTSDLTDAFPGLQDESERRRFVAYLDQQIDRYQGEAARARVGGYELKSAVGALNRMNEKTVRVLPESLLHEFGNGAMAVLDDYSAIIWPDELARFQRSTQGRFVGVGVQIQQDEELNIKVVTPLEGAPAQRAGIRAGDIIRKVNGDPTDGFDLNQAVDVITGPRGTDVTLTIERPAEVITVEDVLEGEEADDQEQIADADAADEDVAGDEVAEPEVFDVTVTRDAIKLPSVKGWKRLQTGAERWDWMVDADNGIGYVRLTQFAPETTADFDKAIAEMRASATGLNGLVLDLRFNPGGLLDQAVEISNRFIPEGLIVQTVDADGAITDQHAARRGRASVADIPVIVLINEGSASASEIVSGAVRHYADAGEIDALLVGERSFGKGSVQNVWSLSGNRTAQKLTTQYYTMPSGRIIHRKPGSAEWGVDPNLTVDMLPEQTVEALTLRMAADVITLDQNGDVIEPDEPRPDPSKLFTTGADLQLQTAVVLLQTRTGLPAHAQRDTAEMPVNN